MLFVLFVCLAVAVLVQTLTVLVVCADRALGSEESGRVLMAETEGALVNLRQQVLVDWKPLPSTVIRETPTEVEGTVVDLAASGGWALLASAWHAPEVSPIVVSGWLERGRDGIDLPLEGLVAGRVAWAAGRTLPWLELEEGERGSAADRAGLPAAHLATIPADPLLGMGITVGRLTTPWSLEQGWLSLIESASGPGVTFAEQVSILRGGPAMTAELHQGWGSSAEDPGLVIVTGGATLEARERGDVYGVIVVNGGDVLLDGTRVHGAIFASGDIDFGSSGAALFSRPILRRATDGSIVRARLVPGTRSEAIE